jgi:dihydroneopterin aldolase
MTLMLAGIAAPEEVESAISGGADIVEIGRDGFSAKSPGVDRARDLVAAVGGRCCTSVFVGDHRSGGGLEEAAALLHLGLEFLRVPVMLGNGVVGALGKLGSAGKTRLVGVAFADRDGDPGDAAGAFAEAGFAGLMLDIAEPSGRLLSHRDIPALSVFVRSARAAGLLVGFAGGLEAPDVPRLLQLGPDFLGFSKSLRDGSGAIDCDRVAAVRTLIPRQAGLFSGGHGSPERTASQMHDRVTRKLAERIFVRDLVLPVRIGAYSDERTAPQKVRFNVSVDLEPGAAEPTGMGQVLSYDLITDGIAAIVAEGHIDFAETLAERIAADVLGQPRARRVTVMVEKLERGPAVVGVEIVAERAANEER